MLLKNFAFLLVCFLLTLPTIADDCDTLNCTVCCNEDTQTCGAETRDCAVETDDDYIEKDIFYIVGAFFGLWVLYKVMQRAFGYYQMRKEHAKLTEG